MRITLETASFALIIADFGGPLALPKPSGSYDSVKVRVIETLLTQGSVSARLTPETAGSSGQAYSR